MTWSYDPTDIGNEGSANYVRFILQDVVEEDPLLQDEEIQFLLDTYSLTVAMAYAAQAISFKFSRLVDIEADDLRLRFKDRADAWAKRADKLFKDAGILTPALLVAPWAGGIDTADKETRAADTSKVSPTFVRTLHDTQ